MEDKFKIIVKTKASKNELLGFDKEKQAYRLNIKAVPEKGSANKEIIKFLSKKAPLSQGFFQIYIFTNFQVYRSTSLTPARRSPPARRGARRAGCAGRAFAGVWGGP